MENKILEFLIVDDSPTTHKYLKKMILNNFDCEVFEAPDAWSSLRLIGNHSIDLILMDINMPDIDGFQTVKMIRKNKQARRIPVIYITGSDPESLDIQKGLEIGGLDFLHKPFKETDLVRMLRLYIRFIAREKELNSELIQMNEKLNEEIKTRLNAQKELAANDEGPNAKSTVSKLDIDNILSFSASYDGIREEINALVTNYYDQSDNENFLMLKSLRTTIYEAGNKLQNALNL
jgi:DNA-binding response OmpR family regulator